MSVAGLSANELVGALDARDVHFLNGVEYSSPDLYCAELGMSDKGNPKERLQHLAQRHTTLTGLALNWVGTYEHAVQRLIRRLESEALWA